MHVLKFLCTCAVNPCVTKGKETLHMGMAAGQARLLSITARLSDNEQNGQALSFAKQRLADEADQVNREYNEALNATKLTVLTGFNGAEPQYTDISYALLTEYNKKVSNHFGAGKQYLVTNQKGQILVTEDIKNAYESGNGDFNVFINKFGLTQTDVDFAHLTGVDEQTGVPKNYQVVHDAWDKYLRSVGLSFENLEHDISDPDVKFSWNAGVGAPQIESKYVNTTGFNVATFKNEKTVIINGEEKQVAIIDALPVGETYEMRQPVMYPVTFDPITGKNKSLVTLAGEPRYCFSVGSVTYWIEKNETAPRYDVFVADADKTRDGHEVTSFSANDASSSIYDKRISSGYTYTAEAGTTGIPHCHLARACKRPINFEGTTKEQRELYDYAVALTKSYAGQDGSDIKSIADNPENAAEIQYYRNIFNEMQQFGYVTEADLKINQAPSTQRANVVKTGTKDNNWFEQGLRQGKLLLKSYDASKGAFVNTTYAEDSNIQEVEDDRRIAKAEVDYTQAQTALERKDKKIDLELKKLDTEHNALQTEYESVKSVVDKNIEKSFNIFS